MKMYKLLVGLFLSTAALAASEPQLQNGDLVFQTSQSQQSQVIQFVTNSRLSHVGIVEVANDGQKYVIEAISHVSRTPLANWIARGTSGQYMVYRYNGLTPSQQSAFVKAAKSKLGVAYDIYFSSHNGTLYCSELVDVAARAIGITIGQYQTLGSLPGVNSQVAQGLIRQRWRGHPLCQNADSLDECLPRILNDEMITPASEAADRNLTRVFSNYPWFSW